jgi:hypothetical protein
MLWIMLCQSHSISTDCTVFLTTLFIFCVSTSRFEQWEIILFILSDITGILSLGGTWKYNNIMENCFQRHTPYITAVFGSSRKYECISYFARGEVWNGFILLTGWGLKSIRTSRAHFILCTRRSMKSIHTSNPLRFENNKNFAFAFHTLLAQKYEIDSYFYPVEVWNHTSRAHFENRRLCLLRALSSQHAMPTLVCLHVYITFYLDNPWITTVTFLFSSFSLYFQLNKSKPFV